MDLHRDRRWLVSLQRECQTGGSCIFMDQGWFRSEVEGLGIEKHRVKVEKKYLLCFLPDEKATDR